ncbi:MAG: glycosyltransferase family 1 protein [Clostridia bacterium]|nr:glycosyltransferase family 1 protein [Clostridia bacterium]
MTHILIFGMNENPGGMESFIMSYYRQVDRSRFQFDFLTNCERIAYEDEIGALGGRVYKICARSRNYKLYREQLTAFFRQHAAEYQAVWMNTCSLANIDYLKMAAAYGIPCRIIHSHNSQNMDSRLRGVLHRLNKRVIEKYATHFWACSRLAGEFFFSPAVIAGPRYQEIPNAIDCDPYRFDGAVRDAVRRELGVEDKLVVGHVGRLHFQKNQSFLLDIFRVVHDRRPDACLLLVGQGEDEAMLRQKTEALGLTDCVHFLGVRGDVPRLMQAMDVFLFPSLFEGLGIVLIEAQAAGLGCVTSSEVPADAKVTDLLTYLPLTAAPEVWADAVEAAIVSQRTDRKAEIAAAGYEIRSQVKRLETLLEEFV